MGLLVVSLCFTVGFIAGEMEGGELGVDGLASGDMFGWNSGLVGMHAYFGVEIPL